MIKKTVLATALLVAGLMSCSAQSDINSPQKYNHYVGFQVNQLIRQILNLSNSPTAINNPYVLTYAIHSVKTGWGLQAGVGYNYVNIEDKTPVARVSKINDLFYRLGVCKRTMISKKFQIGYGLDFVAGYQADRTQSSSITDNGFEIDSSSSDVTSKTTTRGFGANLSLGFYISEKIILGTEVTYYYTQATEKESITVFSSTTNQFGTTDSVTNTNSETDISKFSFSLPVALFLIVKF